MFINDPGESSKRDEFLNVGWDLGFGDEYVALCVPRDGPVAEPHRL